MPGRDRVTPSHPTPNGQVKLQLLVGLTAHRGGLTSVVPARYGVYAGRGLRRPAC